MAVGLALAPQTTSASTHGDTQIVIGRDQEAHEDAQTGDGQLRRTFAGTMPQTGDAATHASALVLAGAAAITLSRMRAGPPERRGHGSHGG